MAWRDEELAVSNSLDEVLETSLRMLRELKQAGLSIQHVAGPISADGDEHIKRNLASLLDWRNTLSEELGPKVFIFTSPIIFSEGLYVRLGTYDKDHAQREKEFHEFWDKLIESGVIDMIHFAPGWERSTGAKREHQTAKRHGLKINYLQEAPDRG